VLIEGTFSVTEGILLVTASGTLWRVAIPSGANSTYVPFELVWKCDYRVTEWEATGGASGDDCTLFGDIVLGADAVANELVTLRGLPAPVRRGDLDSAGGWMQPTTRAAAAALQRAVRARYAAAFPQHVASFDAEADVLQLATPLLSAGASAAALAAARGDAALAREFTRALEASRMVTALPPEHLALLASGADFAGASDATVRAYARTAGPGQPWSASLGDFVSQFPYATPALFNGAAAVFPQYQTRDPIAAGVFALSTETGAATWGYSNYTAKTPFGKKVVIPFGYSRSSPAVDSLGNIYGACAYGQ
jgi:hypothetical protein